MQEEAGPRTRARHGGGRSAQQHAAMRQPAAPATAVVSPPGMLERRVEGSRRRLRAGHDVGGRTRSWRVPAAPAETCRSRRAPRVPRLPEPAVVSSAAQGGFASAVAGRVGWGRGGRRRAGSAGGVSAVASRVPWGARQRVWGRRAREENPFVAVAGVRTLRLDRGCVRRSAGWRWDGALKPRIHITWAVGSR